MRNIPKSVETSSELARESPHNILYEKLESTG